VTKVAAYLHGDRIELESLGQPNRFASDCLTLKRGRGGTFDNHGLCEPRQLSRYRSQWLSPIYSQQSAAIWKFFAANHPQTNGVQVTIVRRILPARTHVSANPKTCDAVNQFSDLAGPMVPRRRSFGWLRSLWIPYADNLRARSPAECFTDSILFSAPPP